MMWPLKKRLRRFRSDEDGNATVEFAIVFPAFMFLVVAGVEIGMVTLNHVMLERAVDLTVRDIRLGTGNAFQHDQIKTTICNRAQFIDDCEDNLRLEMIPQDPRAGLTIPDEPDCTDRTEEARPVREFKNGQSNQLMVLRACVKITPMIPTSGIGKKLSNNPEGQYALTATTAFVQEPQ